jgi:transcriptional repressor NrdR
MRCPFCDHPDSRVVDSRLSGEGEKVRRRRECLDCDKRFTTYERVEEFFPRIVKTSGGHEEYDREKLRRGIELACTERPISVDDIETVVHAVEHDLMELGAREVSSEWLGSVVTEKLRDLDPIAYLRFASVYREFSDIREFLAEIRDLEGDDVSAEDLPDSGSDE